MCPVYQDKRNGQLFIQFDFQKQTHKQYLPKGMSRTDAKTIEAKMRSDLMFRSYGITRNDVLFEDFVLDTFLPYCEQNLARDNYKKADYICTDALAFLKGRTLRSIKPADIELFKSYRMALKTMHKRARKPATISRELAVLSKLFSLAQKNELCDYNPVGRVDRPKFDNVQDKVLRREDEARFLNAFDEEQGQMAKDICVLVLNTGLRQKDVLGLSDFHLSGGTIRLVQSKTTRIVQLPLNSTASDIIAKYSGKGLLFPSPKTGKPMIYIRTSIAGACRRAEIAPITIRDLRRTFATRLAEDGADALTVAMLLGHADLRMVHRYARSVETMRIAVEKLVHPTTILRTDKLRIAK